MPKQILFNQMKYIFLNLNLNLNYKNRYNEYSDEIGYMCINMMQFLLNINFNYQCKIDC